MSQSLVFRDNLQDREDAIYYKRLLRKSQSLVFRDNLQGDIANAAVADEFQSRNPSFSGITFKGHLFILLKINASGVRIIRN